jgi:VWFA-related protein
MRFSVPLVVIAALAQAPVQQPPVTFKVEVNYVEIDASVTDAQGNFVRNLTKDDFQIVEDGKPQTLTAFAMVDIPVERIDPPLYSKAAIPPDVVSNARPFDGRVFVLVMDDLHTRFARTAQVRRAARQFVERYVGANDVVAVVNTSGYGKGMQDFTGNRALALRAIDSALGIKEGSSTAAALQDYYANRDTPGMNYAGNSSFNEMMRWNNARNSLRTLKNLADFMGGMRGRRKAVVLFSEGINYDLVDQFKNPHSSDVQAEMRSLFAAATRNNVSYYTVDPRGVTSGMEDTIELGAMPIDASISTSSLQDELRIEHDSLRIVAEETGGFAVLNQNDFRNAFSRILADNSSYYVLGYYPTNDKRDGRFRNVQVRVVNQPALKVRTRKGYNAPVPSKKESATKGTGAERTSPELLEALESPVPVSGLTLSAFAAPFKGPGNTDAIALAIEVDATVMKFAPKPDGRYANDLEVTLFAMEHSSGKVKDGARDVVGVVLRPQVTEMRSPFRVVRTLKVPPGRYQVRIGAKESGGKVGAVMYDIDAPDFSKGPIALSGLVLSSAAALRIPTANPGGNDVKDLIPLTPSASREFVRGDELSAFVEIYDNLGKTPAHRVVVTTTVLTDEGKAVFTSSDERASDELSGTGGGYGHVSKVPLSTLAPGRYVLRLEARPTLGNSAPILREVEFSVR